MSLQLVCGETFRVLHYPGAFDDPSRLHCDDTNAFTLSLPAAKLTHNGRYRITRVNSTTYAVAFYGGAAVVRGCLQTAHCPHPH